MRIKKTVSADNAGITQILQFLRDTLAQFGAKKEDIEKAVLVAEEAAKGLATHSSEEAGINIYIRSLFGHVTIELSSEGEAFDPTSSMKASYVPDGEVDASTQEVIGGIILKSFARDLKYRHLFNTNRISFTVLRSPRAHLYRTLAALGAAVITGLILSALGFEKFNTTLDTYLLVPVYTIYLNALKMVVAPVVFLSIVSCIIQFSDISELGRIGGRVISVFVFTTVIACFTGIAMYFLFKPGTSLNAGADMKSVQDITSQTMDVSIKDLIVNTVPSDFLQPFVSSNMLQLIFLAVFCGVVTGHIGRYSATVGNAFEAFNELFLKMTTTIIHFMPVAVFCSICSMILTTGISLIVSLLSIFATFLAGLVCMISIYCLILAIAGRINPLCFLRKYVPVMTQVFSMASSNASIPINMEACEKMGVAKKVYCLTIPLGATLNMDGACVYMAVFALALARSYGVTVTFASMAAMVVSIIVLSMGAPGIPGSGLICLSVLLTQIGVPAEAVGLVMGIDAFVGMFRCMSNCTGDVMTSILVARKEGMLDMDRYNNPAS